MASEENLSKEDIEKVWHDYLVKGSMPESVNAPWYTSKRLRGFFRRIPSEPRCDSCYYPFKGLGGIAMRSFFDIKPSSMNPHLCNICEQFARKFRGGAEIDLTILFADVRGSTQLAQSMNPTDFSRLISRFFKATTSALYDTGALVEKLIGDAVTGFFTPGLSKYGHAQSALKAAQKILTSTGHGQPTEPWIPVGVGIHTGKAYVGSLDSESGPGNIVVLGDTANMGARLASAARTGEVVISQATARVAGINMSGLESRKLELKGINKPVEALVMKP
jgi:adenylate cyclase